jgi:hypothetical protein
MTDQERITREQLLKRAAAAAGAVYVAPVLTSSAAGAIAARCKGQRCGSDAKCQKRGGPNCFCVNGACTIQEPGCSCARTDPNPCSLLEVCGAGNCACFQDAKLGGLNGVCVDLRNGLCSDFLPCDVNFNCGAGEQCFNSCCGTPLCSSCCPSNASPSGRLSAGGAGSLYLAG